MATARKVLPVPAGPMAKVTSLSRMACTYCVWPWVFERIGRPRAVTQTTSGE